MLLGSTQHSTYNKNYFKKLLHILKKNRRDPNLYQMKKKKCLLKKKGFQDKPSISKISISIPDVEHFRSETSKLMKQPVVSKVIDELVRDPDVGNWIRQGLSFHTGERKTDTCRFCGNELSQKHREKLEAHFNDAFASFQKEIDQTITNIEDERKRFGTVRFPHKPQFMMIWQMNLNMPKAMPNKRSIASKRYSNDSRTF